MTQSKQLTFQQWLSSQPSPLPRYQIVESIKFYGHYDVLDTHTGKREPCGNLRTARATCKANNSDK